MRFGAMLWMQKDADMGDLRFAPKKRELHFTLPSAAKPLYSEVAQARLRSLADALDAEPVVHIRR